MKHHFAIAHACMCMYTNKRLYSVIASLAPFKEQFRASAECDTKNTWGIEPLCAVIIVKICARADSSCTMVEKRLQQPLQVLGAELKTSPSCYFVTEELHYHYEALVSTKIMHRCCGKSL